jgi:hypothetical protein
MFPPANRLKDTVGVWKASLDTSSAWQRVQGFPEGIVRRALLCCAENGSKQNQPRKYFYTRTVCKTEIFVQNQGMRKILPQAYN